MSKIYGSPLFLSGAGGANKDLPPLLDNFKAFEGGIVDDGLNINVTIQADKMLESRANELAGAVWVYGDHEPESVNDGTKIQLAREECVRADTPPAPVAITFADIPVSDSGTETIVNLKESDGQLHPYIYLSTNYWGVDGALVLRKDIHSLIKGKLAIWPDSPIKTWCNSTFYNELPFKQQILPVTLEGQGFTSSQNYVFVLTVTELGESTPGSGFNDGKGISYFSSREKRISNYNDNPASYWLRTTLAGEPYSVSQSGVIGKVTDASNANYGVRPAFVLPSNFKLNSIQNEDGSYDMYEETSTVSALSSSEIVVQKSIPWSKTKDFYARQFTYNSKKQYQTMLEGAIATITLVGVPEPVSELAETHSGSSITLTWKNPTSDEFYDHTVVVYKTDAFPTSIDDGTQGYTGTDETATLSGLELGSTYYIAVFTVNSSGVYGQPQTVQVEIPAGLLISSLASGTKVKLGKWNNTDLQWKVARDTSDQSIRLVLEPTSVSLLGGMQYDAKEPRNSDSNRKNYGNNRYIYSNIHQWLNATKATGWYVAQHSADAAPAYDSSPGFLSGWSENHIAALDRATLTASRANIDGGGTETFVASVALISTTELGLQSSTGGGRLDIFNNNGDRNAGISYWTRTPNLSNSNGAYLVDHTGSLGAVNSVFREYRVRPLCIPVSTASVSLEMDDDNCYVVQ